METLDDLVIVLLCSHLASNCSYVLGPISSCQIYMRVELLIDHNIYNSFLFTIGELLHPDLYHFDLDLSV